jgi:Spy/CpxP family protein refolding chaperone
LTGACAGHNQQSHEHSPYSGQEKRAIKSLSDEDVKAYTNGDGMGFAKLAELNGFPGPKHILENEAAIELSPEQKAEVEKSFQKMKGRAIELGKQIVEKEKELDDLFQQNKIDTVVLQQKTSNIANLQAELRVAHLEAHLEMKKLLSPAQVEKYNRLRGYQN